MDDYALEREPHCVAVLIEACECVDRAELARLQVEQDGAFVRNRFDEVRAHPGLAVERDQKTLAARLFRELSLGSDFAGESRVPRQTGAVS